MDFYKKDKKGFQNNKMKTLDRTSFIISRELSRIKKV